MRFIRFFIILSFVSCGEKGCNRKGGAHFSQQYAEGLAEGKRYSRSDGRGMRGDTNMVGGDGQADPESKLPEDFMLYWKSFRRVILEREEDRYEHYVNMPLMINQSDIEIRVEDRSLIPRIINAFMRDEPSLVIMAVGQTIYSRDLPFEVRPIDNYTYISRLDTDLKPVLHVLGLDTLYTMDTTLKRLRFYGMEGDIANIGHMYFERIEGKWKLVRLIQVSDLTISLLGKEVSSRADTVLDSDGGMTIIIR